MLLSLSLSFVVSPFSLVPADTCVPENDEPYFYMLVVFPPRRFQPLPHLPAEDRNRISPSNFPLVRAESQSNNHLRALHSYLTRRGSRFYTPPSLFLRPSRSFLPLTCPRMAMPLGSAHINVRKYAAARATATFVRLKGICFDIENAWRLAP